MSTQTPGTPTKAQKQWLRAIGKGTVYQYGHSWVNAIYNRDGASHPSRSNYVMTCNLHDAGWINRELAEGDRVYRITLTDAGRAALGAQS